MAKKKHNYRDSLFVDMFGKCENAKENFLSLYNAIHDTNLKISEVTIEPITLKNVVYTGVNNDVSMRINDSFIVLAEQQSTVNYNMPLRCLEYVTAQYGKMFKKKKKYAKKMIGLPRPEFYVFYNGKEPFPKETVMKLSDAFIGVNEINEGIPLELKVKVYNINMTENIPILRKSIALFAYSKFSEYVRIGESEGQKDSIGYALDRCIAENILAEYFEKLKREDRGMIFGEYSFKDHLEVACEEAFENGVDATKISNAKNLLKLEKLSAEEIAQCCSLPLEQVLALQKELESEKISG